MVVTWYHVRIYVDCLVENQMTVPYPLTDIVHSYLSGYFQLHARLLFYFLCVFVCTNSANVDLCPEQKEFHWSQDASVFRSVCLH